MCRLTEKNKKFACTECLNCMEGRKIEDQYYKLQELEDIEEEIGISLITLSEAKKNGVYVLYKQDKSIRFVEAKCINRIELDSFALNTTYAGLLYFSDYGKTWALTKEELEVKNNEIL